jgi:hypothetical protein
MGEVINKEYLTRDDLLAMRREIDAVLSVLEMTNQRIVLMNKRADMVEEIVENLNKLMILNFERLSKEAASEA